MRRLTTASLAATFAACSPSETSIVLTYPTPAARTATKEIAVYAFPQEENAATATCKEFTARLPKGEQLGTNPVDDPFALMTERRITNFPAGAPVVLVVGYNAVEANEQKPILQGCTDTYGGDAGYTEVPVAMEVIIPAKASLNKLAGDHQVGRPGQMLPVPLRILVDAAFDMATQRFRYPLPAVPVKLEVMGGEGPSLNGGAPGAPLETTTDENGLVVVQVMMPLEPKTYTIKVSAPKIQEACEESLNSKENKAACKAPAERLFVVSTVDVSVPLARPAVINGPPLSRVVGIGVGNVVGDANLDAVILGCNGGTEANCAPGRFATLPLGQTQLSVINDVGGASTRVAAPMGTPLGILPGGLFVGPLEPGGYDEIALVNSRRADCQNRRCEGSEALVFTGEQAALRLIARETLTASNAVSLAGVRREADGVYGPLVTAAQGRSTLGRECSRASMCLFDRRHECPRVPTPEECAAVCVPDRDNRLPEFCTRDAMAGTISCTRLLSALECSKACNINAAAPGFCNDRCLGNSAECGCPPNERCECTQADGCPNISQPGTCVAQDKFVDRITNNWAEEEPTEGFSNAGGCHMPSLFCTKGGEMVSSNCSCGDIGRANSCQAEDGCGCKVPAQISIGDQAGVVSHDVAVGRLTNMPGADLLAASDGGLDFLPRQAATFKWSIRKSPTRVIHFVRTLKLDRDNVEDIAWLSKAPCEQFANASEPCPLARDLVAGNIDGQPARGCLGVYVREQDNKVDTVRDDGCRRYQMPFEPAGACVGDVNGDSFADLVSSTFDRDSVFLYLGDGSGGLLDPPLEVPLPPGGKGGIPACADVDGDELSDVLVAGKTGVVSLIRSAP